MSNNVINPYQQFLDDDGQPVANGTIDFNVDESTTLGTIYSNEALTVTQANPYTLDGNGCITGDVKYRGKRRLVLKDADGAHIRTMDNVVSNVTDTSGMSHIEGATTYNLSTYLQNLTVDSIEDMLAVTLGDGGSINVVGYHPSSVVGGGTFTYDSAMAQTSHDGGTIFGKDAVWPDWTVGAEVDTWFTGPASGTGCFVRQLASPNKINAAMFGVTESLTAAVFPKAVQASLDYFPTVASEIVDADWELPDGDYSSATTISFPASSTPEAHRCKIKFNGRIISTDNTVDTIKFYKLYECDIKTPVVYSAISTKAGWADGAAAVNFVHNVETCKIRIGLIYGAFTYGVRWNSNDVSSTQFTDIWVDKIYGPKYKMYFDGNVGSALSYFSANNVYGGAYSNQYQAASNGDGSESLHFTKKCTNINFYGPHFANDDKNVNFTTTTGINVFGAYYDTPYDTVNNVAGDLTAAANMVWTHGGGTAFGELNWTITSDSKSIQFINTSNATYTEPNLIISKTGLAFYAPEVKNLTDLATFGYDFTSPYLYLTDHHGKSQILNKATEGGTTAPTTGTYRVGAVVWNTSNIASGQPTFLTCKTYGTMGTLNGGATTGAMTIGLPTLVVNSATGIKYGQSLAVAGAITQQQVIGISGTTITLSGNASATVAGAAVSFVPATFQAGPNYP